MDLVSIQQAESFLGIESGEGGNILQTIVTDVSAFLANYTGRSDWGPSSERTEYFDGGRDYVLLNYWPSVTIGSIYDDPDKDFGADTILDADDYHVDNHGIIWLRIGNLAEGVGSVKVTYTAGYASTSAIPSDLQSAALRYIEEEWNYRNRAGRGGQSIPTMPDTVRMIVEKYRRKVPFA